MRALALVTESTEQDPGGGDCQSLGLGLEKKKVRNTWYR